MTELNESIKILLDEPIEYVITTKLRITSYSLICTRLVLNKEVEFILSLHDDFNFLAEQETILITGDEYKKWGSDDEYINQIIKKVIQKVKLKYVN